MPTARSSVDPLSVEEATEDTNEGDKGTPLWEHQELSQIPIKVLRGHTDAVSSCSFCFEDSRIVTSSHDRTAKLWDAESGVPLLVFDRGHSAPITGCALTPDHNRLITASWDKTMKAWDMKTGEVLWSAAHDGLLTSCSVSPDGNYVASSTDMENAIYITCVDSGEKIFKIKGHHKSTVTGCRFDPGSQRVASVSADKSIKLWDFVARRTTLSINSGHSNVISSCCFTGNGRHLCTASWDKTLRLWDIPTGRFRSRGGVTLSKGHEGNISSCVFSEDSSLLVSGACDRNVTVWDMEGPCKKLVLKGHTDWVTDVSISADKKWIASSSKDSTLRLWNIENSDHIPAVIETRKAAGFHIVKCEACEKPFSLTRAENSDFISKCVFCRLTSPSRNDLPAPPVL
ncbi:WD repeat-containing protein 88 isoform X1 [Lepisosteus oculatus]|uniref:WD repeat-containing protein 88 isoform X1 n=1 Tax=Lepisosteus oculatus TaxID=7918 RepID=UPI0035F5031C